MEGLDFGRAIAGVSGGAFLPIFHFIYGDGDVVLYLMIALAIFIMLDWIAGRRASKKDQTYASEYGIDGVFRTFFMLTLPAGGHFIDLAFGLPPIFFGMFVGGLLYDTIQSVAANVIRAGWDRWIPEWALVKVTDWVKSELENKVKRSLERKEGRSDESI